MQTRVPIVNQAQQREATGKKLSRAERVHAAALVGASEVMGRHVEALCNQSHWPLIDGAAFYAMPKRERREQRAGKAFVVEKISKRYVYLKEA